MSAPTPPPPNTQATIDANFTQFQKRYEYSWPDNTPPILPRLNPSDTFFNSTNCPLCTFSASDPPSLRSHLCNIHPNAYQHPEHSLQSLFPPAVTSLPSLSPLGVQSNPWNPPPAPQPTRPGPPPAVVAKPSAAVSSLALTIGPHHVWSKLYCDVCHVQCETPDQFYSHRQGQKHHKRVEFKRQWDAAVLRFSHEGISSVSDGLWGCAPCRMVLDGQVNVIHHLESTKHKRHNEEVFQESKKRQRMGEDDLGALLRDVKSAATEEKKVAGNLKLDGFQVVPGLEEGNKRDFSCAVCGVSCNSQENLNAHLDSIKHKKKVALLEKGLAGAGNAVAQDKADGKAVAAAPYGLGAASGAGTVLSSGEPRSDVGSVVLNPFNFYCDVCNINCSGQQNFDAHLRGKPHAKKLRQAAASRECQQAG